MLGKVHAELVDVCEKGVYWIEYFEEFARSTFFRESWNHFSLLPLAVT